MVQLGLAVCPGAQTTVEGGGVYNRAERDGAGALPVPVGTCVEGKLPPQIGILKGLPPHFRPIKGFSRPQFEPSKALLVST